jgi:hypothetical protein
MYEHHTASIARTTDYFANDAEVLALILGGSIAHGYARPASDIDVLILVADSDYERRRQRDQVMFFNRDLCTYPDGYVDGKYVAVGFLDTVAGSGSEPARFAYQDARVLFSRIESLDTTLQAIARYPVEHKAERIRRFYAQFEAWNWYVHEALKLNNTYLLGVAVSKLVLFGGRLILAHNELLYPYHKWFLNVLAAAPQKPESLLPVIADLCANPSEAHVSRFYEAVKNFRDWGTLDVVWPHQFMLDSELNWLDGHTPVDDV